MPGPILFTNAKSVRGYCAQISAKYCDKFLQVRNFEEADKKLPITLIDGNVKINDSNAISFYLSNEDLRGKDLFAQSAILQWMIFADNHILSCVSGWVLPSLELRKVPKESVKVSKEDSLNFMEVLNKTLVSKTYFVGERITLADIAIFTALMPLYEHVFDPQTRKKYENVNRWFKTMLEQPKIKEIIGNFTFCEKAVK